MPVVAVALAAGSMVAGASALAAGAAGLAAVAAGAMVVGGALSIAGTVTGNAKLAKIGGILSLAGGVGTLAVNALGGAASAAGAAEGAASAATDTATAGLSASDGVGAALDASSRTAADAASAAMPIPQPRGLVDLAMSSDVPVTPFAPPAAAPVSPQVTVNRAVENIFGSDPATTFQPEAARFDAFRATPSQPTAISGTDQLGTFLAKENSNRFQVNSQLGFFDKAGKWVQENPEFSKIGADALRGFAGGLVTSERDKSAIASGLVADELNKKKIEEAERRARWARGMV
ncbi:MAG TPA: hypothetical protein VIT92_16670 [Burkholderiaceae bacterium]